MPRQRFGCRDNRNGCGDKILYFGATVHQLESRGILLSSPLTLGCVLSALTHLIPLYLCEGRRGAPSLPAQTAPSLPSQTTSSISTPVRARWFNEQQECCLRQFLLQQRVVLLLISWWCMHYVCLYRVYIYNVGIAPQKMGNFRRVQIEATHEQCLSHISNWRLTMGRNIKSYKLMV